MCDDIILEPGTMYSPRKGKINCFLFHWRNGRKDNFPICCIFRFCVDNMVHDGKVVPNLKGPAVRRGVVEDGIRSVFVPCNIFHRKTAGFYDDEPN